MKKKILIGLALSLILYIICSIYIGYLINTMAEQHREIAILNHVEELRRNLNGRFRRVQNNLRLINTKFQKGTDTMASDLSELQYFASTCIECHHHPPLDQRLRALKDDVDDYIEGFKGVVIYQSHHNKSFESHQLELINKGNELFDRIASLSELGNQSLKLATSTSIQRLIDNKRLVYVFLTICPLLVVMLTLVFINKISTPLESIVNAIRQIKSGNFSFRMDSSLPDEFGQIAEAFNEMSETMQRYIKEIDESNRRYRMLFESAADAIFIISAEGEDLGKIIDANNAAAKMHGYTKEELCSMKIQDIDVPEDAHKVAHRIALISSGGLLRFEVKHYRKDGSVFPVEVTANLLEIDGRKYVLAIDRDITLRKETEEKMLRAEQLANSGRIAAGIAHEIKNPLAGIKAAVEMMIQKDERGTISEDDSNTLISIIDEIRRIEGLLKQILDYARPQKRHPSLININFVIDSTISLLLKQKDFQNGSIMLKRDYDPTLPEIMLDPQQMRQVLMNLLINSKDAMPTGGVISIKTSLSNDGKYIVVEVADTGEGIPREIQNSLFLPFATTKAKGSGLGLAICRQIIEAHGGTITFKENVKKGTIFAFTIPLENNNEL